MPRLPVVSGREAVSAFERAGWQVRRRKGSHIILTKPGLLAVFSNCPVVIASESHPTKSMILWGHRVPSRIVDSAGWKKRGNLVGLLRRYAPRNDT